MVNRAGKTRKKLDEAEFFLRRLLENRLNHPDFDYYLSAFISSARSIPWVMRAEFAHVNGWEDWYKNRTLAPEDMTLLTGTNQLRVRTVKQGTAGNGGVLTLKVAPSHMTDALYDFLARHQAVTLQVTLSIANGITPTTVTESMASSTCRLESMFFTVPEFPGLDIVTVCHRYLELLRALVEECEDRFFSAGTLDHLPPQQLR